ncbi:MAG: twin-arginine translocase TatA/TatE family subunit [Cyanobacteria bacterium SZAS-4]|nr:twin-arginine translocase TatA/TatE family subunit [Cyanobacteria bacterium SZAS-4]
MLGSPVDIAIIGVVVLVVFGPKKVPELGKALGQGIGNFKRALSDVSDDVKAGINESEKKDITPAPTATPTPAAPQTADAPDEKAVSS